MKKTVITIMLVAALVPSFSQNNKLETTGFVGIGTLSPQRLIHISYHDPQIIISETDRPTDSKSWGFRAINDEFVFDVVNDALTAGSRVFSIKRSGLNVESFSFLNGNVGIGTTSPTFAKLQIRGGATHELFAVNRPNSDVPALYLGNNGTNHAAIVSNNADLTFGRDFGGNYTEYMRIQNGTGNVGIGTTDPQRLFHISNHDPQIIISETDRPLDSKNWAFRIINDEFVLDAGNDALTAGNRVFSIKRSGLNIESFSFLNGNIGIGTNPEDRLHLTGTNPTLRLSSSAYYGGAGGAKNTVLSTIKFSNRDDNHSYRAEIRGLLTGDWAEFVGLAFTTNSAGQQLERMRINHDGTVGIGTSTTGSHKLAVEGSIGAREIKVEASGWSDFVFEKGYELRTLEEVEEHIEENGHLPEIPTEAEVTENGINLGEMNAKLLQKIEELTLYLIEEHKTTKKLTEEVEQLKQELSDLKGE